MTFQNLSYTGRLLLLAIAASLLLPACAQTSTVDNWKTDEPVTHKPDKVAVIAVLPDALNRKAVEIDVAKIMAKKGNPVVPSSNIPGMSGGIRGEIDPEAATGLLRQANVDGVIVMFYAGAGKKKEYIRSDYWLEYLGTGSSYSWGRPYFTGMTSVYTVRQGPDIVDFRTSAYVESSYYDLETEKPVWRIVTFTKDTEHADTAADIAETMAKEMRSAGLKK